MGVLKGGYSTLNVEVALCIILIIVSWLVVALRLWVRWRIINALGGDDLFVVIALIFFSAFIAMVIAIDIIVPTGNPSSFQAADLAFRYILASEFFYDWSIMFLKLSLGLFFLRVLVEPWHRYVVHVAIALSTAVNFFCSFWAIFVCGNPAHYLTKLVSDKCVAKGPWLAIGYLQSATNTATDIVLAIIPIPMLWGIQMNFGKKLMVASILMLATVGCIASIIRIKVLPTILGEQDYFKNVAKLGVTSIVELGTGLTASSLATMKPLLSHISKLSSSIKSSITTLTRRMNNNSKRGSRNSVVPTSVRLSFVRPELGNKGGVAVYDSTHTESNEMIISAAREEAQKIDPAKQRKASSRHEPEFAQGT